MYRNGYWNDHNCGQTAAFVCKFGRGHYPVTDEGPDEGCQKGWQGFEDHCYLFVVDEYHSQEGAKKACTDYPNNGVLAKIPDQETNGKFFTRIFDHLRIMGFQPLSTQHYLNLVFGNFGMDWNSHQEITKARFENSVVT